MMANRIPCERVAEWRRGRVLPLVLESVKKT